MINITKNLHIGRENGDVIIGINDFAVGGVVAALSPLQAKTAAQTLYALAEMQEDATEGQGAEIQEAA